MLVYLMIYYFLLTCTCPGEIAAGDKKENLNPLLFPIPSHKSVSEWVHMPRPNYQYPRINSKRYQVVQMKFSF